MIVTTPFITDANLQEFMPDILQMGVLTFAQQNLRASNDVYDRLVNDWWAQAIIRGPYVGVATTNDGAFPGRLPPLIVSLLNTPLLAPLVSYRALGRYIMPMLSGDADANGDMFSRRAERYTRFYNEEWERVITGDLYDFNRDGNFTLADRLPPYGRRVKRA